MQLTDSINELKGVGEKVAVKLGKLGIFTVQQMIEHYPREYEDRREILAIENCIVGETNHICAKVCSKPQITKKNNKVIVSFQVKDESSHLMVTFFGQPYMKTQFKLGETYLFYGKVKQKYGYHEMESPQYQKVETNHLVEMATQITPVYPVTHKLSQKVIRGLIQNCLKEVLPQIEDSIPLAIREQYQLVSKAEALMGIHFPRDKEHFLEARKRLVFEELFMLQLSLYQLKADFGRKLLGVAHQITPEVKAFIEALPFDLTGAQRKIMKEIASDMKSQYAMNRLVQGDVGSGKTVIAAISLFIAVKDGYQGALMAPTEVLVRQHHQFIEAIMKPFNIKVGLLTGSTTAKQKRELLKAVQAKEIDILIGTHALIEENVEIPNLGLVITDEQHRFGVRQRLKLTEKGQLPDVMVMTATPIPRTLALILYGDMDISIIDELPPGRQPIQTNSVDSSYHPRIYRFIEKQIEEGRQCYIICPMVEENEKLDNLKNVVDYAEYLQGQVFPHIPITYLHGKMKPKEKNKRMEEFQENKAKILVSTTVIEVGVNVPNATLMVIENAERFGLSQLHQLRGRVGRGSHQSYCVLVTDSKNKVTQQRMKIMEESTDGFVIAETDLKLRGPGEFFGTKQHGLPEMKIANLYTDAHVLKEVQQCVKTLLELDPLLSHQENQKLLDEVEERLAQESLHNAL